MAKAPRPTLRFIDRFVLLVAWLVTCGLVYALGYYVGRGTPGRSPAMEERTVRLPVTSTPPPEGQRPKEAREFPSFYQALPSGERPIDVARGTPVTAPSAGDRVGASAGDPIARATTTTAPARAAVDAVATTTTTPRATTTTLPRTATTTTLVRPGVSATLPYATTTVPSPGVPTTTLPRPATRGGFTVQASPTRSRSEAEDLLGQLRRRGYDAALVQMQRDGDTWYRLRVGRYATAQQANEAMRKLRDAEGVSHAFVATE